MLMNGENENVNLLWTGGWDSTFQLLRLLLVHKVQVTPFYVIDEERRSTGVEIQRMSHIKKHLFTKYPQTKKLLHPTRYFGVSDILPDSKIEGAYETIRLNKFLGSQYVYLAKFCKQNSISNIQLCVQRGGNIDHILQGLVVQENMGSMNVYRIDSKFDMTPEYTIFRFFSFPIFDVSKVQMAKIAEEKKWMQIMKMTWFCHEPKRSLLGGMKPCGKCNPCIYAIEQGHAWRIPISSRLLSLPYRIFIRPVATYIRDSPRLRKAVKGMIRRISVDKHRMINER